MANIYVIFILSVLSEHELIVQATNLMGRYLSAKDTNTRYMALEAMCNLSAVEFAKDSINKHQQTVLQALKVPQQQQQQHTMQRI